MAYRPIESKSLANEEYDKALRQAFWRDLFRRLRSRCDDLVPASELLEQLTVLRQRDIGLQEVSLNLITGSGRFRDFNLHFDPKRRVTGDRWHNIAQAILNGQLLPPPHLVKIEEAYLVLDGNHRISVAHAFGRNNIQAKVIELEVADIEHWPGCSRLGFRPKAKMRC